VKIRCLLQRYDYNLRISHPPMAELACVLQVPVPLGMDLLLTSGEHILRRDAADSAVQADVVVMLHVSVNQTPRGFQ
jgi:hypothetical protein